MTGISTVTVKGQTTIPEPLRALLGIRAGDRLYFEADHQEKVIRVKKLTSPSVVDSLYGSLHSQVPYADMATIRQSVAQDIAKKYGLDK